MNTKSRENIEERSSAESFESRYVSRPSGSKVSGTSSKSYPAGFGKDKGSNLKDVSLNAQPEKSNIAEIKFTRPAGAASAPGLSRPKGNQEAHSKNPKVNIKDSPMVTTTRPIGQSIPLERAASKELKTKEKPQRYLSSRDLEILEFALDMKFVSVADMFDRFFSTLKNGEKAKSEEWAQKKLRHLAQIGFLKNVDAFSETTRYYIATDDAYTAVMQKLESEKVPKALKSIDQRIFLHDKLVLKARLEFEKQNPGCRWISDRRLRAGMAKMFNVPSAYIPDAIYELPSGEVVAFELENAMKGKAAYQEKISYFAKLIEMKKDEPGMFTRVAYRCVREDVFKKLKEETEWYDGIFTVDLWHPDCLKPRVPVVTSRPGVVEAEEQEDQCGLK